MKDQRTSYGAKDKRSSVQQIRVLDVNCHSFEKNWTHGLALVGLAAGWLADEIWLKVEIFKILCRLNYLEFCYV